MSTKASKELLNRLIGVNKRTGLGVSGKSSIPRSGLQFYADLWHPEQQGFLLSYDGNDYLSNATANFRSADSEGAIEVWFRTSDTTDNQVLFSASDIGTTTSYLVLKKRTSGQLAVHQQNANDTADLLTGGSNIQDGKWHHVVLSSSGTAYTIFLDGIAETLTLQAGSNTGDWFADTTLCDNVTIGERTHTGNIQYWIGEIGYTRIYSRPMLQPEAQLNYQRGRKASASDTTGLVFNLPTTEGTGNPVDTVGSLTMTLTGATWVEGLMDRSTNALPMSSFGSPTWGNTGRTFDGTSNTIVPLARTSNFSNGVSIVWWEKTLSAPVNAFPSKIRWTSDGFLAHGWISGDLTQINWNMNQGAVAKNISAVNMVLENNWRMISLTYDNTTRNMYSNTTVRTTSAAISGAIDMTGSLSNLGGISGAYSHSQFGEYWVYERGLTAQEILQIFNSTRGRYGV